MPPDQAQAQARDRKPRPASGGKRQEELVLQRFGDTDGFTLRAGPLPSAGPGEVRIRVLAARFFSIVASRKQHPDWYRADLDALLQLLSQRAIRPLVAERIGLGDVADAHRRLAAGGVGGKIVICP